MMVLMLRAILFPGSHLFVTTGGKEQAASSTVSKIEEICKLIPAFSNELKLERGETKKTKNDVHYKFKNGSEIDILAATERSRGQRRTGRRKNILRWSFLIIVVIVKIIYNIKNIIMEDFYYDRIYILYY